MGVHDRLDDLDVVSVRLFLTAAELGSVSKAAARHGLTQPSATARIQKLERTIGVQLLERSPTGSNVTTDGQQLMAWCHGLVAAASALTEGARALQDQSALTLRLAATADVATHLLPAWLAEQPLDGVDIDLVEAETASIAAMLRNGDVELGLLAGPSAPLSLRSEIVDWFELVAVAPADHRLARQRRSVTGAQLAASNLILRRRGSGTLDVIEMALAEHELGVVGRVTEVSSHGGCQTVSHERRRRGHPPCAGNCRRPGERTSGRTATAQPRDPPTDQAGVEGNIAGSPRSSPLPRARQITIDHRMNAPDSEPLVIVGSRLQALIFTVGAIAAPLGLWDRFGWATLLATGPLALAAALTLHRRVELHADGATIRHRFRASASIPQPGLRAEAGHRYLTIDSEARSIRIEIPVEIRPEVRDWANR